MKQLSWRDPAGFVVRDGDRILRAVAHAHVDETEQLLSSAWIQARIQSGDIVRSTWVDAPETEEFSSFDGRWLQHDLIAFPGYPHEISALQLHHAAKLTLSLALEALENGWILKDATPWNVLFCASKPVFCDLLSFEPVGSATTWAAYAQFQRSFTIPLLLNRHRRIPPRIWFLAEREGKSPESAKHLVSGIAAWTQPGLEAVTLPALLSRHRSPARPAPSISPETDRQQPSRHVLRSTLRRLNRHIDRLSPLKVSSFWSDYQTNRDHYEPEDLRLKTEFVRNVISQPSISRVLDIGCNTGEYSLLAATLGKSVVSIDLDDESIQRLYEAARTAGHPISPLVLNIAKPTPAIGWLNDEVPSFLQRAATQFDCILALGLLHHLIVTERIPLPLVVDLFKQLNPRTLVIEWIDPNDPRFRDLSGPNSHLYTSLTKEEFESILSRHFRLISQVTLPKRTTRTLYVFGAHN